MKIIYVEISTIDNKTRDIDSIKRKYLGEKVKRWLEPGTPNLPNRVRI